jgi:hypothetical protein
MKIQFFILCFFCSSLTFAGDSLRYDMDVLPGLFVRAGGPGGKKSLPVGLLENLCAQGVGTVFYLYPSESFTTKGTYSCGNNQLAYKGSGFIGKASRPVLEAIASAAQNNGGPVVAHCWNGWHASGEVAAYALMQFCDWSGEQAAQYWADNIGDSGNLGKYKSILKRIKNFEVFGDLKFNESQKNKYCR